MVKDLHFHNIHVYSVWGAVTVLILNLFWSGWVPEDQIVLYNRETKLMCV